MKDSLVIFWFRRDLRLIDNHGLFEALRSGRPVLCLFIFDPNILTKLTHKKDARVGFIYDSLVKIQEALKAYKSTVRIVHETPLSAFEHLMQEFTLEGVYANHDYEPYATARDHDLSDLLGKRSIPFHTYKDQAIFEKNEILKDDKKPYTVFTPYKRKWLAAFDQSSTDSFDTLSQLQNGQGHFYPHKPDLTLRLEDLGFERSGQRIPGQDFSQVLGQYAQNRNFPSKPGTSRASVHLRFGTVSIRQLAREGFEKSEAWLNELIWRDFYFMILWQFPRVVGHAFKPEYDRISWKNDQDGFNRWCRGETGYPLVDAGMRELNETGFMHNRVRMVVASFLTKHLLIDWRWGEAYFAEKLLDFELSSNNGGWQWAAGCGVDAAPYFRIFNPYEQEKKFDSDHAYVKRWVKEWNTGRYPLPMVEHPFARARCLDEYKKALKKD